jgi:hypothetical protein
MRQVASNPWAMPLSAFWLGTEVFARTVEAIGSAAGQGLDEMVSRGVRGLADLAAPGRAARDEPPPPAAGAAAGAAARGSAGAAELTSGAPAAPGAPGGPAARSAGDAPGGSRRRSPCGGCDDAPPGSGPAAGRPGGRVAPCRGCRGGSLGDAVEALGPLGPWLMLAPLTPLAPIVPVAAPMFAVLAPLAVVAVAGADAAWRAAVAAFEWAVGGGSDAGEPGAGGDAGWQALPAASGAGAAADRPGEGDDLRDERVKLVRYTLLSLRPEEERILRRGETLITESLPDSAFTAWAISQYLDAHELPPGEGRYLRVHRQVVARYDRRPFEFPQRQVAALEEIRDALLAAPPAAGVPALPAPAAPAPPANPVAAEDEDHG